MEEGKIVAFDEDSGCGSIECADLPIVYFHLSDLVNLPPFYLKGSLCGYDVVFNVEGLEEETLVAKGVRLNLRIYGEGERGWDSLYTMHGQNWRDYRHIDESLEEIEYLETIDKYWGGIEGQSGPEKVSTDLDSMDNKSDRSKPVVSIFDTVALTLVENKIKLVSFTKDGKYRFLDESAIHHNIIYPSFFEEISLQLALEEFEDLINTPKAREKDFQDFFEHHPGFLLNDDYKHAHSHVVLTRQNNRTLIPDFILEPVDQTLFCDLLELKLPSAEVFVLKKNRPRYSAAILDVAAQLREYGKYFDQEANRKNFQETYPHLRVYKPRMFVIIGRQSQENMMLKREIQSEFPQLFLKTYDELLSRMKWRKEKIRSKNTLFDH